MVWGAAEARQRSGPSRRRWSRCPIKEELGEPLVGREVQIREELLTRPEPIILLGHGLLDLHDKFRGPKHIVCPADDPRAGRNVLVIGKAAPDPAPACTTTSRP